LAIFNPLDFRLEIILDFVKSCFDLLIDLVLHVFNGLFNWVDDTYLVGVFFKFEIIGHNSEHLGVKLNVFPRIHGVKEQADLKVDITSSFVNVLVCFLHHCFVRGRDDGDQEV